MTDTFQKGAQSPIVYPLTDTTGVKGVASPKVGVSHDLPMPKFPQDSGFCEELQEVIAVRMYVVAGIYPYWFLDKYKIRNGFDSKVMPEPLKMKGLKLGDPAGCANIVHMDSPDDLGKAFLDWLMPQKPTLANPSTEGINFLNLVPDCLAHLNKKIDEALNKAFEAKYFYGRPRPEEVFMNGELPVHPLITHYVEGCPKHPAYPAGHGAAAGATYEALSSHFRLTAKQDAVLKDICYLWAMYRTFAGVHYADDNLQGLAQGGLS